MRRFLPLLALGCPDAEPVPEGEPRVCGVSTDLLAAPPPVDSAMGPIAPVDLLSVTASAVLVQDQLDVAASAVFLVGERDALPVLELRPELASVRLDGEPVALERVTVGDPAREVRVLPALDPCSEHVLEVEVSVDPTWMVGDQKRLESHPEGMFWAAGLEDDGPGKFLGMWMPSNLLFDRFDLSLDIDVSGLPGAHELLTTGVRTDTADGWSMAWSQTLAHSPFWVVSPTAITRRESRVVPLPDGDVTVEVRALEADNGADPLEAADRAEVALVEFSERFGPYHHGDRYLLWIRDDQNGSMEYDGATLTAMGAIEHEIFHSWFARGTAPVADLHGWIDEAITSWVTDLFPYRAVPIDYTTRPLDLQIGDTEWAGAELGYEQYVFGSSIIAGIADDHGVDAVIDALAAFYLERVGTSYRAAEIEEHLTCWFDDDEVRRAFRHRGYGLEGPLEPRPFHWCR